jgi:hypothetical protein
LVAAWLLTSLREFMSHAFTAYALAWLLYFLGKGLWSPLPPLIRDDSESLSWRDGLQEVEI